MCFCGLWAHILSTTSTYLGQWQEANNNFTNASPPPFFSFKLHIGHSQCPVESISHWTVSDGGRFSASQRHLVGSTKKSRKKKKRRTCLVENITWLQCLNVTFHCWDAKPYIIQVVVQVRLLIFDYQLIIRFLPFSLFTCFTGSLNG